MLRSRHLFPWIAIALIPFSNPLPNLVAAESSDGLEFFEKKIRPVLVAECYECHGAEKQKGGLRLDWRQGWQKGGDSGAAIVPGDVQTSLLLQAIRHEDPDLKMPSKSPKLDDAIIRDFERWVNMGAPDPRDTLPIATTGKPSWEETLAVRRTWWALQPVEKPAVPQIKDAAWSTNPIDRFLLAKMEANGLAPAPDADPHTLIRRLTFTLTGLPPTPEDVEGFVRTCAGTDLSTLSSQLSTLVDRLLASPRFGEHWARHWMDLVRYADTHGSEGDPPIPEAWRYRDYLIRAFNVDVPVDCLIREHLAGDLLPEPRWNRAEKFNESVLGIAQLRMVEHGFQPVDTRDEQVKVTENQIDVVMKAFQGLTVTCARCHDHKFDAVSQRDYYALAGIFESSRPAMVTIDAPERLRKNWMELTRLKDEIRARLYNAWQREVAEITQRLLDEIEPDPRTITAREEVSKLEAQLAALDNAVRARFVAQTDAEKPSLPVRPLARWTFERDARDVLGGLHGELKGGARLRNGRLVLDGKTGHLRSSPLAHELREKTLEAWVTLSTLDQAGGAPISVEDASGDVFDAIVFGERAPRRWMAGSDGFRRSRVLDAPVEAANPENLVHVAATYRADGTITLFRNGQPCAAPWKTNDEPLVTFAAGAAHVLLGLRHAEVPNGFLAGEIDDARLYDRALNADEIAASFREGPNGEAFGLPELLRAMSPEERVRREKLAADLAISRQALRQAAHGAEEDSWRKLRADAERNTANPLHAWAALARSKDDDFARGWRQLTEARAQSRDEARREWRLGTEAGYGQCFHYGSGLDAVPANTGDFSILPDGDRVLAGLRPGGAMTDRLSNKHHGVLTTRRFRVESDFISVFACGGGGAQVRLIVDGYPLGQNGIFPRAKLDKDEPAWVRLDVKYRKGASAYLEFATAGALTRHEAGEIERSWFAVSDIVCHDGELRRDVRPIDALLAGDAPQSPRQLAQRYAETLRSALGAWRDGRLDESQGAFLDAMIRSDVLPSSLAGLSALRPLVEEYRRLEREVPAPRHAPGVFEADAADAAFLPRGDHTKPGEPVPRAFFGVFGGKPFASRQSGRLELAECLVDPRNPLTARVAVNRIWQWLFGRGLVPTPDNFGRMGEKPTHPELLDFLAAEFVEGGWSTKDLIRLIVTSRAFQISSEPSAAARERDPSNAWLSHFPMRRLEAESIRDALLAVPGNLDRTMFGPGAEANSERRSVYLAVRRTSLQPFLGVFDAPKPFSTLGRRDSTNVPAQSLTLLNSEFVINQARTWARTAVRDHTMTIDTRIRSIFAQALARPPSDDEVTASLAYLEMLAAGRGIVAEQRLNDEALWQDFAQSLFNLKEFIYLR